jgi:hypothetical protein
LAKAFTLIQKKGISAMKGLTTATLKAISTTRTLNNMYEEIAESVENFTPATDTMAGMDWISDSLETMKDMINKGEFGNIQLHSYLEAIFDTNFGDSQEEIQSYYNKLRKYAQYEGAGFWRVAGANGGIKDEEGNDLLTLASSKNFSWDISEGATTEQLLQRMTA